MLPVLQASKDEKILSNIREASGRDDWLSTSRASAKKIFCLPSRSNRIEYYTNGCLYLQPRGEEKVDAHALGRAAARIEPDDRVVCLCGWLQALV